jgi:RNA polymerase sigma-70 factor, ECF subfamily
VNGMETKRDRVDAFSELWQADYWPVQRYFARRLPPDDVDEALAEAFLVAWRRIEDVPSEHLLWMYGVARRVVLNQRRSLGRRSRLLARIAARRPGLPAESQAGGPDNVLAALAMLSPADREVLRLVAWEGLTPAACARVLGCSRAAFDVRVHRARTRLASALAQIEGESYAVSPSTAEGAE